MVKNKWAYAMPALAVALGVGFCSSANTFANGVRTTCEGLDNCVEITSANQLMDLFTETVTNHYLYDGELNVVLTGDIDFSQIADPYFHEVNINLYLGNQTMEMGGTSLWFYENSVLNIYGGTGSIHNAASWAPVYFYDGTDVTIYSGNIINDGVGTVNSKVKAVEVLGEGSSLTMEGGVIDSDYFGIQLFDNAQFVMNDGTLRASAVGLSGNGTIDPSNENYGSFAIATINGGTIEAGSLGIYAPHDGGVTTINGGTINSGSTGVELRAGTLNITGGKINVSENAEYTVNPNGNGSTTDGVAVAVSQHTTKKNTTLSITGGELTAPIVVAQNTTTDASAEDIAKVSMSITGGTLKSNNYNSEKGIVYSQDFEEFITGGVFSNVPTASYVASGYDVYADNNQYIIDEQATAYQGGDLFLQVGDVQTLDLGTIGNQYATLSADGTNVTIDGRTITAVSGGSSVLSINYNGLAHPMTTNVGLVVYDVAARGNDDSEDATDRTNLENFFAAQIKEALANRQSGWYYGDKSDIDVTTLKQILLSGDTVTSGLIVNEYFDEEDAAAHATGYDELTASLNNNERAIAFYSVSAALTSSNLFSVAGFANTLDEPVTLRFAIPDGYTGTEGTLSVLRSHYDRAAGAYRVDRMSSTRDGDDLLVENDEFSTFVVAYTAPEEAAEETGAEGVISSTTTPDTGVVTREGASAIGATIVTSMAVGLITSIVSFAVLIRRK